MELPYKIAPVVVCNGFSIVVIEKIDLRSGNNKGLSSSQEMIAIVELL